MKKESFVILWEGSNLEEYTVIDGTLEDAISEARHGYWNYGRKKATVIKAQKVYEVKDGAIEQTFV